MAVSKIFMTGATGYVGGSLLSTLLKYPDKYAVTALVRGKDQAETLKKLGVSPVLGTMDDLDLLAKYAEESDAVLHFASAEHLPPVQALVQGLKAKKDKRAVFLHTSGCHGLEKHPAKAFDDEDMSQILSIPRTWVHKDVDAWIFDNTDDLTAAIIAPSAVNGIGNGPFKKTSSYSSINLAKAAVARKKAGWVGGNREAMWGNVNIHDLVELYRLVLDGLLANRIKSGKEGGFYWGSVGQHTWGQVADMLGVLLHEAGKVETTDVSQFEKKYVEDYVWGEDAANVLYAWESRVAGNRGKRIGWKPQHPNLYQTLEQEINYHIAHGEL